MERPQVAVEFSKCWEAEDISETIVEGISDQISNPDLLIVGSTIHHKSEIEEALKTFEEEFPSADIIGGTVAGFMTRETVSTRGTVVKAIKSDEIEVSTSLGRRTKIKPEIASISYAGGLRAGLDQKDPEVVITNISGPSIPKIPFLGRVNRLESAFLGELFSDIGLRLARFFNSGLGREEEVYEHIGREFSDSHHIGGSNVDDFSYLENYQFLGGEVYESSVVGAAIRTDMEASVQDEIMAVPEGSEFEVTKRSNNGHILRQIEGRPASDYYLEEIVNVSGGSLSDLGQFYYEVSDYFPLSLSEGESLTGVGAILGNNLLLGYPADAEEGELYTISGRQILNKIDEMLSRSNNKGFINLVFASGIMLNLMGAESEKIRERFNEHFEDEYLALFYPNEFSKRPGEEMTSSVYSLRKLVLGDRDE